MVDVVANHMGYGNITNFKPVPLNQESSYHSACDIHSSNQNIVENCRIAGLPDVNTQSSEIRKLYQDWIKWLVSEFGFDGVRIDTVKHVEKDFRPPFASAAGVYIIGEVFDGGPDYLVGYGPWLKTLLPPKLTRARVLTYGYDAYIVQNSGASSNRLIDGTTNLLSDISHARICR